ncbi:MAG: MarR family transcriptional regulator [Anaerolineae bacterium]|nr:MarR family transcriptional regulator [Anaerolineae bacterium]NUQ06830.1 MarR family transcriptional regulator [Anaerolineae bacterium]
MPNTIRREISRRTLDIIPLIMRVMSAEMRQSLPGIQPGHISLLGILRYRAHTLGDLADRLSVSAPTMSNTISTLEERGWVGRRRAENDRRLVWIEITDAGQAALDKVEDNVETRLTDLLSDLNDQDAATLVSGLTVLRDVFATALESDPKLCNE